MVPKKTKLSGVTLQNVKKLYEPK